MENTATNIESVNVENILQKKTDDVGNAGNITNYGMCNKNRKFNYETQSTDKGPAFYRAAIIKNTIINALKYDICDEENIKAFMAPQYPSCEYPNFQQMRMINYLDFKKVMRYLKEESRRNPVFPRSKVFTFDKDKSHSDLSDKHKRYRISVDIAFPYVEKNLKGDSIQCIELICYKIGKSEFSQTGNKNSLVRDLRLYLMILLGRELGYQKITASYYYLTKNGDCSDWNKCPQSFFGGGGNIIQMTDEYYGKENQTDKNMIPKISTLINGIEEEDQCKEDCEYCDKYDLCKFAQPPRPIIDDVPSEPQPEKNIPNIPKIVLTKEQKEAVEYMSGILRLNAGAGAGKTMVVVEHIKYLINHGVLPEEILATTFTNAGAKEMLHRSQKYIEKDLSGIYISTINSFLNDIVIKEYKKLNFPRPPKVMGDVEKFHIIADILNRNPIYEWQSGSFMNFSSSKTRGSKGALRIVSDIFSRIKKLGGDISCIDAADVREVVYDNSITDFVLDKIIQMYPEYEEYMRKKGLIDFDDQEMLPFSLFEKYPDYLKEHYKFKHIIIDECQDLSESNIKFIKLIYELPTVESLVIVGDDAQAIFGFKGTTPDYIIHFENYIGHKVDDIFLQDNHRSTPEICEFANRIIEMNVDRIDKKLIATRPSGVPVIVNGFYEKKNEERYIVDGIMRHIENGTNPHDIAIITYTKDELRKYADLLTDRGIPSMFGAPEPKLENSRVRAILAFSRVISDRKNTKDALAAANAILHGNIMDKSEEEIQKEVTGILARAKFIDNAETLEDKKAIFINYIDDIMDGDEVIEDFKKGIANKDFDEIMEYCYDFTSYGESEEFRRINEYPGVVLITAHSSKGLEYPVVYNSISKYQPKDIKNRRMSEEIRRLLFVSATRARDELYVSGVFANGTKGNKTPNIYLANAYSAVGKIYDYDANLDF